MLEKRIKAIQEIESAARREMIKAVIGVIAGMLTTGSFIPQVWSIWTQIPKPATDIALGMFIMQCLGVLLWFIYGCFLRSIPMIIFNLTVFVLSTSIVIYKIIFG